MNLSLCLRQFVSGFHFEVNLINVIIQTGTSSYQWLTPDGVAMAMRIQISGDVLRCLHVYFNFMCYPVHICKD